MTTSLTEALAALIELHDEVDRLAAEVAGPLAERLACAPGCTGCCVDDVTVFEVEAERIRRHAGQVLEGAAHPPGDRCALLDPETGLCRVYEHRPYVCRTQGLPLRWLDEGPDGELLERRDICPENDGAVPLLELPAEGCWTLGPVEGRLATLQASIDGGELRRIGLRELFDRS